jgi:hypothetical protein
MTARRCPDCHGEMEVGFVPEFSDGSVRQSRWHPGRPEQQKICGISGIDPNIKCESGKMFPITTYRCKLCHVLRAYAES